MKKTIALFILLFVAQLTEAQTTRITVMTYNLLNYSNGNTDVVNGDNARTDLFTQIIEAANADVILVQELTDISAADLLLNSMNTNGTLGKNYARATAWNPAGGFGNMLFFNSDVLELVSQTALPQLNTATAPSGNEQSSVRIICEFVMNVVNPACETQKTEIRFYDQHLKAANDPASGTSVADNVRRDLGCQDLMDYVNTLAPTVNVVAAGDFNFYGSDSTIEPGYTTLTNATNTNPLIDIIGAWTRNSVADVAKYTQSTRSLTSDGGVGFDAFGNGGVDGGLDDRFDLIFFNGAINTNTNYVQYVAGSYEVFGNVGVPLNGQIDQGGAALANEIMRMSDHYPVILDLDVTFDPATACVNCNPSVRTFPVNN